LKWDGRLRDAISIGRNHSTYVRALFFPLLASLLGTCTRSDSYVCASGLVCPRGTVCDGANRRCVTPQQLTACENLEHGANCSFPGGDGLCDQGACVLSICGNHYVEPDEVCDDGNRLDLDGCRNDCRSDETCGNGIVDSILGEACDDQNFLNHDGCASACEVEQGEWRKVETPEPGSNWSMAYDTNRARILLVGGFFAEKKTWFLEGNAWVEGPLSPFAIASRTGHEIVYDANRRRLVLFGGAIGATESNAWFLDATGWSLGPPPPVLLKRIAHAMVFDAKNKRVIVFGGYLNGGAANDTWFLDGETWVAGPTAPPELVPRYSHGMAYDSQNGRVVLFGGSAANGPRDDTWYLTGTSWSAGPAAPAELSARSGHRLIYDPKNGRVVLFGGFDQTGWRNDTWYLQNDVWIPGPPAPAGLTARLGFSMAYDAERGRVILFGGSDENGPRNDTWFLENEAWSEGPVAEPPAQSSAAMAYDEQNGHVVTIAGSDTWFGEGQSWLRGPPLPATLIARFRTAMAYDAKHARVVLFGGVAGSSGPKNDTWFFANNVWSPGPAAPAELTARHSHRLAYDRKRERIVLFGGGAGAGKNDTWFLDGDGWIPGPAAPTGLTRRYSHAMAYDAHREQVVLFGGFSDDDGMKNDTWLLTTNGWVRGPEAPDELSPRVLHAMTYDPVLRKVVLAGGSDGAFGYRGDSWFFDGEGWTAGPAVAPRDDLAMAYDSRMERVVLFGGSAPGPQSDSWAYQYRRESNGAEDCRRTSDTDGDGLSGCADPDCFAVCTPHCPPHTSCDPGMGQRCGDGSCNQSLENCRNCPGDCGACIECGDFACTSPAETAASCPGDCD
jgi:cysteine-rich repeat protein